MKTLYLSQINANLCRTASPTSKKVVDDILTYKQKAKMYDEDLEKDVIKNVTKTYSKKFNTYSTFPMGLFHYVVEQANKMGYQIDADLIAFDEIKYKLIPQLPGITFEPYQKLLLKKVGANSRGILVASTGAGKSIILGGIVDKFRIPETILIVPTQTIFNQMYKHFCNWFGEDKVGRVGQQIKDQRHITICLYQSIKNYKVTKNLKLILIDEAHLINKTINQFLTKCKNVYYRYSVTGSPFRFDTRLNVSKNEKTFKKPAFMHSMVGPTLYELKDEAVEKRVVPADVKLINYFCNSAKGSNYQESMRVDVLFSFVRNKKFLKAAKMLALDKGLTCLILIDEVEQGKIIVRIAELMGIDITFAHGELSKGTIKKIIKDFNDRKINCVVATKVFGVGTDIPNVDCVCLASERESEQDILQKIGRGRRRTGNKDKLIVIDCVNRVQGKKFTQHFYKHSLRRIKIYKRLGWDVQRMKML